MRCRETTTKKSGWLKARAKHREAFIMCMNGSTLQEIADKLGYKHESGAKVALDAAVDLWDQEGQEFMKTAALKSLQNKLRQLDVILDTAEKDTVKLNAIEGYRKYIETINRMIGLNAAEKVEISGEPIIKLVGDQWDKI